MKNRFAMIMLVAAMAIMALASASAYVNSPYPNNYVDYAGYQPRVGAYYGPENFQQTWYGYLDSPRYMNGYGYPWTITNIRPGLPSAPAPVTYQPNIYRASNGYPGPWEAGWSQWSGSSYGNYGGYGDTYPGGYRGYNYAGFAY